jgi:hypothetical protein
MIDVLDCTPGLGPDRISNDDRSQEPSVACNQRLRRCLRSRRNSGERVDATIAHERRIADQDRRPVHDGRDSSTGRVIEALGFLDRLPI